MQSNLRSLDINFIQKQQLLLALKSEVMQTEGGLNWLAPVTFVPGILLSQKTLIFIIEMPKGVVYRTSRVPKLPGYM